MDQASRPPSLSSHLPSWGVGMVIAPGEDFGAAEYTTDVFWNKEVK